MPNTVQQRNAECAPGVSRVRFAAAVAAVTPHRVRGAEGALRILPDVHASGVECAPRGVRNRLATTHVAVASGRVLRVPEGALRTVTLSPSAGKERRMIPAIVAVYVTVVCGFTFACRHGRPR